MSVVASTVTVMKSLTLVSVATNARECLTGSVHFRSRRPSLLIGFRSQGPMRFMLASFETGFGSFRAQGGGTLSGRGGA